jgi:ribose 5-phosphate isomerase B
MKIAIGSDHAAIELRKIIIEHLKSRGMEVLDKGAYSTTSTHYPIYAQVVSKSVASGEADLGILICGTGVGMGISANKVPGVRAATVSDTYSARMSREHNNANVLTFGARVLGDDLAKDIVDAWLNAEFQGGRHQLRVDRIHKIESGEDITNEAEKAP